MSISRTYPKFPIHREKFKDEGAYNEVRQLTYQLDEFRRIITDTITFLQDANRLGDGALSSDPNDPTTNHAVIWQSDGTGTGGDGDIMMKITDSSGTTKTTILVDFSAV